MGFDLDILVSQKMGEGAGRGFYKQKLTMQVAGPKFEPRTHIKKADMPPASITPALLLGDGRQNQGIDWKA